MNTSILRSLSLLYSPRMYFLEVKGKSSLLGPFLVFLALLVIASLITLPTDASYEARDLERSGLEVSLPYIKILLALAAVCKVAYPFAAAGVCWFLVSLCFDSRFDYKSILAIVLSGETIYALGQFLMAPITVANASEPVSISLAQLSAWLGGDQARAPFFLASKVELFFIWEIAVVAIGLSVLAEKRPGVKIVIISVVSVGFLPLLSIPIWI